MPIPVIIGGAAVASGVAGVKKGLEGKKNFDKAKKIGKKAEKKFKRTKSKYERVADSLESSSAKLGKLKLKIQANELKEFAELYSQLEKSRLTEKDYKELEIDGFKDEIEQMKKTSLNANEIINDGFKSLSTGALASLGISGIATKVGVASTGTKLATLSGAAATKAKLAWLGGGALKAGGGGVLLGKAVLFGAAAGPALAIAGFSIAKKSEKALTDAYEYKNDVDKKCAKINESIDILKVIKRRIKEVDDCLRRLKNKLRKNSNKLEVLIDRINSGLELSTSEEDLINYVFELAMETRKIMDKDILTDGNLNQDVKEQINIINSKF